MIAKRRRQHGLQRCEHRICERVDGVVRPHAHFQPIIAACEYADAQVGSCDEQSFALHHAVRQMNVSLARFTLVIQGQTKPKIVKTIGQIAACVQLALICELHAPPLDAHQLQVYDPGLNRHGHNTAFIRVRRITGTGLQTILCFIEKLSAAMNYGPWRTPKP